ncbi:MAG: BatA domain-containing protein, partial [Deltaproteobacteria bacterium]|nr:BatA domain-containing protein [Deltaproteobacteria bacterium]
MVKLVKELRHHTALASPRPQRHFVGVGSWTWLHPWLLAGLAGAALPVIIHLIGRRRAPTLRFAAFDFLVEVNKRLARRERLRQILLLITRTLAVAAIAFAVARPLPVRPAPLPVSE